jgi:hypothetical protein
MKRPFSRLWSLAAVLAVGYSAVLLLPETPPIQASRLGTVLPTRIGDWEGVKVPVSEEVLRVLAKDTRFERRIYEKPFDVSRPPIDASFVYSGKDMNNSIHRPETCLRTQGWNFVRERYVGIPGILPDGADFPVREIICNKISRDPTTGVPRTRPDGQVLHEWQLIYYTFIGASEITPSHYGRTLRDIRDRITGGYDQQWAYTTFATQIPGRLREAGFDIQAWDPLDEAATGEYLADFMRDLLPTLIAPPSQPGTKPAPATPIASAHAGQ